MDRALSTCELYCAPFSLYGEACRAEAGGGGLEGLRAASSWRMEVSSLWRALEILGGAACGGLRVLPSKTNSDPQLQKGQRSRLASDKRRLDRVLDSYREMKRKLGRDDSQKLEHYLHALRDVEKEIERMERWTATPKPKVPADGLSLSASEVDPAAFIRTMYSLIYLAFKTDSTRYATYMLQSMNSSKWDNVTIALGLGGTHHVLAHNAVKGGQNLVKLGQYDKFQADLLAEFITKLADTPEGEGTMLENTVVLYGSSNSRTHVNTDYPMMLVGGERLGLKQGAFHDFGKEAPPLSNLYLTLTNALGVPAKQFSDSTGTIGDIIV